MKHLVAFFCTTVKTRDAQLHLCVKDVRQSRTVDVVLIVMVAAYADDPHTPPAAAASDAEFPSPARQRDTIQRSTYPLAMCPSQSRPIIAFSRQRGSARSAMASVVTPSTKCSTPAFSRKRITSYSSPATNAS